MSTVAHEVIPHEAWIEARTALLEREKEFTRLRDELSQARRDLPWEAVEKQYVFEGPGGRETLADLFDGRSQLIVYHFMYPLEWELGCSSCSFWADNFDPVIVHLNARDVSMVAVSISELPRLQAYQRRMGWSFRWVSSYGTDFNRDFGVGFTEDEAKNGGFYNYRVNKRNTSGILYSYQSLSLESDTTAHTDSHSLFYTHRVDVTKNSNLQFFVGPEFSETHDQLFVDFLFFVVRVPLFKRQWSTAGGANYAWQGTKSGFRASFQRAINDGGGFFGASR